MMEMLRVNRDIYGTDFVNIAIKYTENLKKDRSESESNSWFLLDDDSTRIDSSLVEYLVDLVYAAGWIGLAENCPVDIEVAKSKKGDKKTVWPQQFAARADSFRTLWQMMVLLDERDGQKNLNERLKLAFSEPTGDEADYEFYRFWSYVYGGLKKIDEMFEGVSDYFKCLMKASELCNDIVGDDD